MEQKKYLKWYNKLGYGSGDIGGNVIYGFLAAFVMIFLTDNIGMNVGVIGTLMAVSKLLDGVSDIFFGSLIDKTKSKMGKARPWMLWAYLGNVAMLIAIFMILQSLGSKAQYAYFFITYTLLNAVFYTANNIAYASLTSLITKNSHERVQMGAIRFIFAFATNMVIQTITVGLVSSFGGGVSGWRTVAIIYAIVGLISNTISVMSVKELPPEELDDASENQTDDKKLSLIDTAKILVANKYYLLICVIYILSQIFVATLGMGIYYMTYVLNNAELLGIFSMASNLPLIAGLIFTPMLVKKFKGMYKVNLGGYGISVVCRVLVLVAGMMKNIPLMLIFSALAGLGMSPMQGSLNALIAEAAEYTYRTTGKRIDGTLFSCSSLGMKIGGGLGTAICGWLLAAGGYVAGQAVQPQSCINMLNFMYLWLPLIIVAVTFVLLAMLKVEQANAKWDEEHK